MERSSSSSGEEETHEQEFGIPEGWEWVLDIVDEAHLPYLGMPVQWPSTEHKHTQIVYNPQTGETLNLANEKKGKNAVGFITSTRGKNVMPGATEPAAARFTRYMEPKLQSAMVKDTTGEILVPCIAHGDYVKVESLESDHAQAKANILKRQTDLVNKLNEDDEFAEFIMQQPGMEKFFIKTAIGKEKEQYYGTLFFYEVYFNDIDNIWLICDACNSKKTDEEALSWFQGQWLYGAEFLDFLARKELKDNGILIKAGDKKGLAQIAIEWFWDRHANYISIAQRIQQNVVTPLKFLSIQTDRVIGLENEKRGRRLMASLDAQMLLVESMAQARIGMPKGGSESSHSSSDEGRRMSEVMDFEGNPVLFSPGLYKEAAVAVSEEIGSITKGLLKKKILTIKEKREQEEEEKKSLFPKKKTGKQEILTKKPVVLVKAPEKKEALILSGKLGTSMKTLEKKGNLPKKPETPEKKEALILSGKSGTSMKTLEKKGTLSKKPVASVKESEKKETLPKKPTTLGKPGEKIKK